MTFMRSFRLWAETDSEYIAGSRFARARRDGVARPMRHEYERPIQIRCVSFEARLDAAIARLQNPRHREALGQKHLGTINISGK